MNASSGIGLFAILSGIAGITAFVWAWKHRQLGDNERAEYLALEDEPDSPAVAPAIAPARSPVPPRARWLIAVLIVIFAFIAWSVVLTILAASHTPQAEGAQHGASLPD